LTPLTSMCILLVYEPVDHDRASLVVAELTGGRRKRL